MESDSKLFRQHIRQFNAAFAFTSMCAKRDDRLSSSQASRSYQICGSSVHLQGPLTGIPATPAARPTPSYASLYLIDPSDAVNRVSANPTLRSGSRRIFQRLADFMAEKNPFVALFRHARSVLEEQRVPELRLTASLRIIPNRLGGRQYDIPTSVGGFLPGIADESSETGHRDIRLYLNERPSTDAIVQSAGLMDHIDSISRADGSPQYLSIIHHSHPLYIPLQYILFFSEGGFVIKCGRASYFRVDYDRLLLH
ncbi:hypothetical protein N7535_003231 [Penicillium sp. DV-2018c]|nr:hypothetical protein N7535_003231 [Penicillium sp. DV-2018c]